MTGIMTHHVLRNLNLAQKALLAALGIGAIAAPVAAGLFWARPSRAQEQPTPPPKFDVVSVKPNDPKDPAHRRISLAWQAYHSQLHAQEVGSHGIQSERFSTGRRKGMDE